MPKFSRETEDKIIALFEQGKRNSVISRELKIDRGALPSRRKEWEKRKREQEAPELKNPETVHEEPIQREASDSHQRDTLIYTLMRHQGQKSREAAISQAIETQNAFNPFVLNHGMTSPKELIQYFEEEIRLERELGKDLIIDNKISQSLNVNHKKTIAELENLLKERFEEGYQKGKDDHAILVPCKSCRELVTILPGTKGHQVIVDYLRGGITCSDCIPRYQRIYA